MLVHNFAVVLPFYSLRKSTSLKDMWSISEESFNDQWFEIILVGFSMGDTLQIDVQAWNLLYIIYMVYDLYY